MHDDAGDIVVVGHAEATRVAQDAETFSSAVSRYLQIPNGLDGDKHSAFRRLLDNYLNADEVARYSADFHRVAREVIDGYLADAPAAGDEVSVDAVQDLGYDFAVRAMVAWLGWPRAIEPRLKEWVEKTRLPLALGSSTAPPGWPRNTTRSSTRSSARFVLPGKIA